MIPLRCGQWGHIPINVTGSGDVWLDLQFLGCKIGRMCKKRRGWKHFRGPAGWHISVEDRFQYLSDTNSHVRARLIDCDPPELHILPYHAGLVVLGQFQGISLIVGTVANPYGDTVCSTYHFVRSDVNAEAQLVLRQTLRFLQSIVPNATDRFAYWNPPHK